MISVKRFFSGEDLKVKSLRGTLMTLVSIGGGNFLRLISNLLLTRLLFPEAFGLMALVGIVLTGLNMFSTTGLNISIIQNKRGNEPLFLNTVWVTQIVRGMVLWLVVCMLATPVANIYEQPMLATLLPIAGFGLLISGFRSTKAATAQRNINLGRLTFIELGSQAFTVIVSVFAAYLSQSVWALVIGSLAGQMVNVLAVHMLLPGLSNKFQWDRTTFLELFHFGKYIFLSTAAGFLLQQGNRIVLGFYITIAQLGIFSVGQVIGTLPLILIKGIGQKVILPLYRMRRPTESSQNQAQIFRARRMITAGALGMNAAFGFGGIALINLLYDERYALAGPIVVLTSMSLVPRIIFANQNQVLLSYGNSRTFFLIMALEAVLQTVLLYAGVLAYGIAGVILAPAVATILVYPVWAYATNKYDAWDPKADAFFLTTATAINGIACWLHREALLELF